MKEKLCINGEAVPASTAGVLAVELFLQESYLFRNNVLNGKVEFANKPQEGLEAEFRTLTQQALNSIILRAKREDIAEGGSPKTDIMEYINSEEVMRFDPVREYLEQKDIAEIVAVCFRKPQEGEASKSMNSNQLLQAIQREYPLVKISHSVKVQLGLAMKELEFEHTHRGHVPFYKIIPLTAA